MNMDFYLEAISKKNFTKIDEEIFSFLVSKDFSDTKKYAPWIIKTFQAEVHTLLKKKHAVFFDFPLTMEKLEYILSEDERERLFNLIDTVSEKLPLFDLARKHKIIENASIYNFTSFEEFLTEMKSIEEELKQKERQKDMKVKVLFQNDEWKIIDLLNFPAMKKYGAHTKWCVTQKDKYNSYRKVSHLICFINKKTKEKFLINTKTIECKDAEDDDYSFLTLMKRIPPEAKNAFQEPEYNNIKRALNIKKEYQKKLAIVKEKDTMTEDEFSSVLYIFYLTAGHFVLNDVSRLDFPPLLLMALFESSYDCTEKQQVKKYLQSIIDDMYYEEEYDTYSDEEKTEEAFNILSDILYGENAEKLARNVLILLSKFSNETFFDIIRDDENYQRYLRDLSYCLLQLIYKNLANDPKFWDFILEEVFSFI